MATQNNDFLTNIQGKKLDYYGVTGEPTAQCNSYMAKNGIYIDPNDNKKMKVLAQLVPSYTYSETGGTIAHKACTLPTPALKTYNIDTSQNNYQCLLQNADNVTLRFASGTSSTDVIKGCVVPFSNEQSKYTDGDVYTSQSQVSDMLDNAYQILNYETVVYIRSLEQKVKDLTKKRDDLKNIELPKSYTELRDAHDNYLRVKADCDNYNKLYPSVMGQFAALINTVTLGTQKTMNEVNSLKKTLKDYHKNLKIDKLIRNIRELSFVTFFEHVMSGFNSRNWQSSVLSGSPKIAFTRPLPNLSYGNINNKNVWANGVMEVPYIGDRWNDRVSSIFLPPGMSAEVYEHSYFNGKKIVFKPVGYPNNFSSEYNPDFRQLNFNDITSSMRIFGGFNSQYWDDSADFAKRIEIPFTNAAPRAP